MTVWECLWDCQSESTIECVRTVSKFDKVRKSWIWEEKENLKSSFAALIAWVVLLLGTPLWDCVGILLIMTHSLGENRINLCRSTLDKSETWKEWVVE